MLKYREPSLGKGPGRNCSPWSEAQTGAGLLAGITILGGPTLEQVTHKNYTPWKGAREEGRGRGAGGGGKINFPDNFANVLL